MTQPDAGQYGICDDERQETATLRRELERAEAEAARLRERVGALAALWESQAAEYPDDAVGKYAAIAARLCARELLAALAQEGGDA